MLFQMNKNFLQNILVIQLRQGKQPKLPVRTLVKRTLAKNKNKHANRNYHFNIYSDRLMAKYSNFSCIKIRNMPLKLKQPQPQSAFINSNLTLYASLGETASSLQSSVSAHVVSTEFTAVNSLLPAFTNIFQGSFLFFCFSGFFLQTFHTPSAS